jgi:hypothetical protein
VFVGGLALSQLRVFIVALLIGAAIASMLYTDMPEADRLRGSRPLALAALQENDQPLAIGKIGSPTANEDFPAAGCSVRSTRSGIAGQ